MKNKKTQYILIITIISTVIALATFSGAIQSFPHWKQKYNTITTIQELAKNIWTWNLLFKLSWEMEKLDISALKSVLNSTKNPEFKSQISQIMSIASLINKDFTGAISYNNGTDSTFHFNNAIIYTVKAFILSDKQEYNLIKEAKNSVIKASEEYKKALLLTNNRVLSEKILHNQKINDQLSLLIEIKYCISQLQNIISEIEKLFSQASKITILITQEIEVITNKIKKTSNPITASCLQNYLKTLTQTQSTLDQYQVLFNSYQKSYKTQLLQKTSKPLLCLERPYTGINESQLWELQKIFENLISDHITVLKGIDNPEVLRDLCSKTSQWLSWGLLGNQWENNSPQKTWSNSASPIQYEDIPENATQLMNNLENNSTIRIQTIERLKSQPDYNPQQYINQLFKEFYGKDPVFKNPSLEPSKSLQ